MTLVHYRPDDAIDFESSSDKGFNTLLVAGGGYPGAPKQRSLLQGGRDSTRGGALEKLLLAMEHLSMRIH